MAEVLISIQVEKQPEGVWLATSDELPGLLVQADTLAQTLEIAQDVARKLLESYIEHGDPIPKAFLKKPRNKVAMQVPVNVV